MNTLIRDFYEFSLLKIDEKKHLCHLTMIDYLAYYSFFDFLKCD